MTPWDDRIENHQAVALLRNIRARLEAIEAPEDPDELESLERLDTVVDYLDSLIENTDSQLLTTEILGRISPSLDYVRSNLESYESNRDVTYLAQANSYVDQTLNGLGSWPSLTGPPDTDGIRASVESFRRSAGQLIRGLNDEAGKVRRSLEKARSEIKQETDQAHSRLEELSSDLNAQKQRLDTQITEYQAVFNSSEQDRTQNYEQWIASRQEDFDGKMESFTAKGEDVLNRATAQTERVIEGMEGSQERAEQLLDAVGRTGTEFGFKDYAQDERNQANTWRWVTVVSLIAIVAIGVWVLVTAETEPRVDLALSILKLLITVPLGALAAYAGGQSHAHRENERAARNLHLDIRAIDPYIALLDEKDQKAIKGEMARRIFGHRYIVSSDKKVGQVNLAEQIVEAVAQRLRKEKVQDET